MLWIRGWTPWSRCLQWYLKIKTMSLIKRDRLKNAYHPLVKVSVSVATTRYYYRGGGKVCPQMNKFEQVSNDQHPMPLAGGRVFKGVPHLPYEACDVPTPSSLTEWQTPVKHNLPKTSSLLTSHRQVSVAYLILGTDNLNYMTTVI